MVFVQSTDRARTDEADDLQTDDTPLYADASITVNVTLVLLLAFAVHHNKAISDLLHLISTIFPLALPMTNLKSFFLG